ncbi:MAG: SAM-dependent methyltransferase [Deltaproteobacteria bacterium]
MSLLDRLKARIRAGGPLTIADYMAECLFDPTDGYYATREPFGTKGDFTTAPEISQMFGELLGLCLAQSWLDQGAPSRFTLAELGPGRGTLMSDVLRATAKVPGFHAALNVVLAEASPRLRDIQRATIKHDITFIDQADDLPDAPLFLIANEFFDALPIRQFIRIGDQWAERLIGLSDDTLTFGLAEATDVPALKSRLNDTNQGDIVEICPAAEGWLAPIATRIAQQGGTALIIDYGSGPSLGDTFQALRAHEATDPLTNPGHADLTAHVDFVALSQIARAHHAEVTAITPQGPMLEALGIQARAAALARALTGDALKSHEAAFHRLTSPSEMGTLFKAIAIFPKGHRSPAGFAP